MSDREALGLGGRTNFKRHHVLVVVFNKFPPIFCHLNSCVKFIMENKRVYTRNIYGYERLSKDISESSS